MQIFTRFFSVVATVLLLPATVLAQEPEYTFSSESLLLDQCIDTPPLGDGYGWDGVCTCRTNRSDLPYDWNTIELLDGQLIASNSQAQGTCSDSGSLSIFEWRGDESPVKTQELTSSVRSTGDTFGLISGGGISRGTLTNTGTKVAVSSGVIAAKSQPSDGTPIVTIFKRNEDLWFEEALLSQLSTNLNRTGSFGRNMVFLNEQQLLIDEHDSMFIYNTSDLSISQEIPNDRSYRLTSVKLVEDGFVVGRTSEFDVDGLPIYKVDFYAKEGSAYSKKQTLDGRFAAVSENYLVTADRGPLNLRRSLTITTRQLDSSGMWVAVPDATIEFETSSVFDRVQIAGDQLVLSLLNVGDIQIYNFGSSQTWELVQQITVDNIDACDSWCGFDRDIEIENGKIIVKNYTRDLDSNPIAFTIYNQGNDGLWTESTTVNLTETEQDSDFGFANTMRFSLIGDNYALSEVPTQSSDRSRVAIYDISSLSSDPGSSSVIADGCDYSNAGMFGGWGWNATTRESCAPLTTSNEPAEQVATEVPAGCDYSNAALSNGWGWNETTRESCAPLSNMAEEVTAQAPAGCDYSNAALSNGWGWNETTRESCVPR